MNIWTIVCALVSIDGMQAFVFPCEEVQYKLLNTGFEVSTRYVCLIPDQDLYPAALDGIYAQSDNFSTSLANLVNATCAERPGEGPWRVVADVDLNCRSWEYSRNFILIFTSSFRDINYVRYDETQETVLEPGREEQLIANMQAGTWIHKRQCSGSGYVRVFTGAGTGEEEHRFLMKSWQCVDFPDWIVTFDIVITIEVDADMQLIVDYVCEDNMFGQTLFPLDRRIAVMSSGRSDNSQKESQHQTYANFDWQSDMLVTAWCDPCTFDVKYNGYVTLLYIDEMGNGIVPSFHNGSTSTVFVGRMSHIEYRFTEINAEDFWNDQDNFVLELLLSENIQQTTPGESVEETDAPNPTTQKSIVEAGSYCGCELDSKFGMPDGWDTNDIWIDVVIILDTSEAMGEVSLIDASTLIESFIGTEDGDVLITDTNAKFYTRIGLIAMSDKAEVIFNLNMTKADKVIDRVHIKKGVSQINVVDAFNAALVMFDDGLTTNPDRINTRQVIYYMTDSDPKTDLSPLNQFKTSYGIIIVNNFLEAGDIERPGLQKLASDGYYHLDIQDNYMQTIQLFCKANCFCKPDSERSPYGGLNADPAVKAAGGCFHAAPVGVQFSKAKSNCVNLGGGLIASVHDPTKAEFLHQLMVKAAPKSDYFWIGYSKSNDDWAWEDQSTDPYTNWDIQHGEPNTAAVAKCTYVDMTSPEFYWGAGNCNVGFPSVCEFAPCSVGNDNS